MILLYDRDGIHPVAKKHRGCTLSIGVFDGVHRGHRALIKEVVEMSRELSTPSAVLSFYPHPYNVIAARHDVSEKKYLLCSIEERVERLLLLGVEYVFMLNFTEAISKLSYKEFFSIYLDKLLSVEGICIGKNFKFGKDARGDIKSLNELAVSHKILIKTVPLIQIDPLKNQDIEEEKKERVLSSTLIRESVALGKFEGIKEFLSCDYSLSGVIVEGLSHGKQIGFPTLNLALTYDALVPLDGIYLGYVQLSDSPKLEALIFVGEDLVFETNKRSIEAHIIDERFNIKEKLVYVNANFYFLKYMRDNKSFAFLQSLQKAIMEDVAIGKALFRNLSSSPP